MLLFVNGETLIDDNDNNFWNPVSVTTDLVAGKYYTIEVRYSHALNNEPMLFSANQNPKNLNQSGVVMVVGSSEIGARMVSRAARRPALQVSI